VSEHRESLMSTPYEAGGLRIGDADRIAAATALGDHFAAGRLDQDELDERLGKAYAARTYADLEPLFTDLPQPHPTRPALPAPPPTAEADGQQAWRKLTAPPDWARSALPTWRRRSPVARVFTALAAVVVLLAALSLLFTLIPLLIVIAVLVWLTGGPIRRHQRWQRYNRPVGRPPWGGDNAAWYQFGWSGRDWSDLGRRGPHNRPGHGPHGRDFAGRRHHGRRRG
jgi:DUF1707 SHOCT-like domain